MKVNILRRLFWLARGLFFSLLRPFFPRRSAPAPGRLQKVLFIAFSRIGDSVYCTPAIREIKRNFPDVAIDLLCRSYNADVFRLNPHLSNIFVLKKGLGSVLKSLRGLRKTRYDMAIDLTADDKFQGAFLARFSGAKYCIGYDVQHRGFCLDNPVSFPKGEVHAAEIYLFLLKQMGISIQSNSPEVFVSPEEKKEALDLLQSMGVIKNDFLLGIHPGANFPSQRLEPEKWAEFANALFKSAPVKVAVFGGNGDWGLLREIESRVDPEIRVLPRLESLRQCMALIQCCSIFACNNSGPLHIAVALGIPTLSWMGPTVKYRWRPIGTIHRVIETKAACAPCNQGNCDKHFCSNDVTVEKLLSEFRRIMDQVQEPKPAPPSSPSSVSFSLDTFSRYGSTSSPGNGRRTG